MSFNPKDFNPNAHFLFYEMEGARPLTVDDIGKKVVRLRAFHPDDHWSCVPQGFDQAAIDKAKVTVVKAWDNRMVFRDRLSNEYGHRNDDQWVLLDLFLTRAKQVHVIGR